VSVSWTRRFGPDLALTGASLNAAVSLSRLLGGGLGGPAPGPLLGAAAVGAALPAVLAHRRVPLPIRLSTGTLAVALVSLWATSPSSTAFGLPTARTWRALRTHLHAAHPLLVGFSLPLRPTEGVVLLGALLAGLVAVLASVLLHSARRGMPLRPGLALLAPFGLLAFVASQSARPSLIFPLASFVALAGLTLSSAQPAPLAVRPPLTPRPRRLALAVGLTAAALIGATVSALSLGSGGGTAGATPGEGRATPVPPTGLSLTSSLVALEVDDANVVLFRARSAFPTYWQVAVLNTLRHGVWVAGPQPSSGATTAASPAFSATVTVAHLATRILPVPPSTTTVTGADQAVVRPEGVQVPRRTQPGTRYVTISAVPDDDPASQAGRLPVSAYPPALVRAEVALPALPASVRAMAKQATAGARTPLGQAEALVNWFRSGRFRYTLNPPAPAAGADPLVSFLTQTKAGTCEQFAGAFTVLARSLGLPTRLVVGFTAGRRTGLNEVTVSGADAHAWPEVYLGADAGWVSFEPTPQQATGELAPDGVVGPTAKPTTPPATTITQPTTTQPTTPTTVSPTTTSPTVPTTVKHPPAHGAGHRTAPPQHTPWWPLVVLGAVAVALLLISVRFVGWRRRKGPGGSVNERVFHAEREVDRALRKAGATRPLWQPLPTFVAQLGEAVDATSGARHVTDQCRTVLIDAATVAATAERARYDVAPVAMSAADAAQDAARRVRVGMRPRDTRRLLIVALESNTLATTFR
jgi:transglutaminase-like putative cysteine protease